MAFDQVPDGGFLAWTQVAAGFFIFFNTWGLVNTFGSYQRYYGNGIPRTSSTSNISWIGSIQGSLLLLLGLFTGPTVRSRLSTYSCQHGHRVHGVGHVLTSEIGDGLID